MRHVHASNSMMLSSISAAFASRLDINQHRCRLELIHPTTPTPPTKTVSTVGGGDSTGELFSIPSIDTFSNNCRYLFFFTHPATITNSTLYPLLHQIPSWELHMTITCMLCSFPVFVMHLCFVQTGLDGGLGLGNRRWQIYVTWWLRLKCILFINGVSASLCMEKDSLLTSMQPSETWDYITHLTTCSYTHTVLSNSSQCLTLPLRKAPVPLPLGFGNASVPAMAAWQKRVHLDLS